MSRREKMYYWERQSCPTDLFDQIQEDVPWRLGEDLTVPTPHHITLGRCPVSHCGHQEPCLITAAADSTLSGHPTTRLHPHSLKEIMNERWSHPPQFWWPSVSAYTSQNTANPFKRSTSSRIYSRQVTLTVSVPLGKNLFLKVSSFDRKGCQTHSQAAQEGNPGESTGAPSKMTSYVEKKKGGGDYSNEWSQVDCTSFCRVDKKKKKKGSELLQDHGGAFQCLQRSRCR